MEVIFEDNHIIVVKKQPNIPSQSDKTEDMDMLTMVKEYIKEKYKKPGNVYLGLVHRLDRPVSGVMVFAKTSKAASRLSEQIRLKEFKKEYHAIVIGKVDKGIYKDNLLKDKKTNITKVDKNGKVSILEYELVKYVDNYSLVKINLKTGRSHQIRVQFSYHNHPLVGDNKYNKIEVKKIPVCLFANKLTFYHPITKEELIFEEQLPNYYPWNLF